MERKILLIDHLMDVLVKNRRIACFNKTNVFHDDSKKTKTTKDIGTSTSSLSG